METFDYSSWSLGLKQQVGSRRVPLAGTLELTRRCNNRCRHCYNNLPTMDPRALAAELHTNEWIRLLDELAAAGCVWLLLTGGEILLRKDFAEVFVHAKQNGMLVTLFTNGTLVTPELADFLATHRPFSIEITLYGATPAICERVTGHPGSFAKCLRGIRYLQERQLPLKLKATVSTLNRDELQALRCLAQEELGLPFRFDALLNARCDRSSGPLEVRLSPEEVVELDLLDPERVAALRSFVQRKNAYGLGHGERSLYSCGGGASSFAVDSYGRLRVCAISPGEGFDLRGGSFQAGWERFLVRLTERQADRDTKCRRCSLRELCGMCPAIGELEGGDPQQPVDFLCRVAHLRACVFGMTAWAHGDCAYCHEGCFQEEIRKTAASLKARAVV